METVAYEEILEKDGLMMTHVVGNSMLPLLFNRESIVIVESVSRVPPKRGDVVLYKANGIYILHRVLHVKPDEYIIRGDNTWRREYIPKEAVLATLTGFFRTAQGRKVTRNNVSYRLYKAFLPVIRWSRRIFNKIRRMIS